MAATAKNNIVTHNESFSGTNEEIIPIVDYSMLVSDDPNQRSKAVRELGNACKNYGFFMVINHGVPEELIGGVTEAFSSFFDLPETEKQIYNSNDATDTIRWGKGDSKHVSREFIKLAAHPTFHCPTKPPNLPELLSEYSRRVREVAVKLLGAISETLGLHESYIEKATKLEEGYDFYTANDYPSCIESKKPMGQFPHTDPGLLIMLMQNVSGGLQMEHNGKWINANLKPNSFIANIADHLEILSNGKYKSKVHRVVVNNEVSRFTLPLFVGSALDAVIKPAPELVDELHPPAYMEMTYKQYLETNQFDIIDGKSCLNQIQL